MRTVSVRSLSLMVVLSILGIFTGLQAARSLPCPVQDGATCKIGAACNTVGRTASGDCPFGDLNMDCDFSQSGGNLDYCKDQIGVTCKIVCPIVGNPCSGYCVFKPSINCTVSWNKCKTT
jgi:hypothetical protein